jgi:alpha-tubulin suppressor-like RCC1 family protein
MAVAAATLVAAACTDTRDVTAPARSASSRAAHDLSGSTSFSDGFESETLDPYWTTVQTYGTISGTTTPVHGGSRALAFASQQAPPGLGSNMQLMHQFAIPTKGTFSVAFYDNAPGQETLYEQMSLFNSAKPNLLATIGTNDFDANCYMSRLDKSAGHTVGPNANCGSFPQEQTTNVARTAGWHILEIDVGVTTVKFSIDGTETFTAHGDFAFDRVAIFVGGPAFRPTTTGYFDDFSFTPAPVGSYLTSLKPANVWLGLKNSADTGLQVDLRAEVLVNGVVIGSADSASVGAGGSGFDNAQLTTLALALQNRPVALASNAQLSFRLSARRACLAGTGPRSGKVRLWYDRVPRDTATNRNDQTGFGATIDGIARKFFTRLGFALSDTAGTDRASIDLTVNSSVACPTRPYQEFGTWTLGLPTYSTGPVTFVQMTSGQTMTCGRTAGGDAYCWGFNDHGQIGDGTTTNQLTPTLVAGGLKFVEVKTGGYHTCGRINTGATYCWGDNDDGELGNNTTTLSLTPTLVGGGLSFVQIDLGAYHTCGLTSAGAAYCWGRNLYGEIGDGTNTSRLLPTPVTGGITFADITLGDQYHSCGRTSAGDAYCWGWNGEGNLGDGTTTDRSVPTLVVGGLNFVELTSGGSHACGRATDGQAYCWGEGVSGELGNGSNSRSTVPVQVVGGRSFIKLSPGEQFGCALTGAGVVQCSGRNQFGETGDGTTIDKNVPTNLDTSLTFVEVVTGAYAGCARQSGGDVYCWGANFNGEVGDGTTTMRVSPVKVLMPMTP